MKGLVVTFLLLIATSAHADKRIVCLGDSNTQGFGASFSYCDSIGGINLGTGGHSSREGRARVSEVLSYRPKTVIIMLGTGDAYDPDGDGIPRIPLEEYEDNLSYLVKSFKRRKVRVILQTPNCTASAPFNYLLKPYIITARKVANRLNISIVENYTPCAEDLIEGVPILSDYAHLNDLGQTKMLMRVKRLLKGRK